MAPPENPWDDEDPIKPRGRPPTGGRQISVWVPEWINDELDRRAREEKTTKSKLVVRLLERFFSRVKPEGGPKI